MSTLRILALAALLGAAVPAAPRAAAPETPPPVRPAASGVQWMDYGPQAFRRAQVEDRLILLVLDVPWFEALAAGEEKVLAHPDVVAALNAGYVPVRVRADLRPDLRDRYPAEGWPGINWLLPDGRPLWFVRPEEQGGVRRMTSALVPAPKLAELLREAAAYYKATRGEAMKTSAEQEAKIREGVRPKADKIEEPLVWSLASNFRASFDVEKRYFGGPPRLPRFDLMEFLLNLGTQAEDPWRALGTSSLDTLYSKLVDPADGGMWRMAVGLDWEDPQKEKLLDRNAKLLEALTVAFQVTGKRSYRDQALKSAAFLDGSLGLKDGAFASAACSTCPGGREPTVFSGANGLAAAALIRAGSAFGEGKLVDRGLSAAKFLREKRFRPGRGVPHAVVGDQGILPLHLEDLADTAWAFVVAYQATGDPAWLDAARDIARTALANLRDPQLGALGDTLIEAKGPSPLRLALYPLDANAQMARVLVRLYWLTSEPVWRNAAHDILRAYAGSYTKVALHVPGYALALYEYHFPPVRVAVVAATADRRADELRRAAMGSAYPWTMVLTLDTDRDQKRIVGEGMVIGAEPGLYALHGNLMSQRQADPAGVPAALADLRARYVAANGPAQKEGTSPYSKPKATPPAGAK